MQNRVPEEEKPMFMECVNLLWSASCLTEKYDNKAYRYLLSPASLGKVRDYFEEAGWDIIIEKAYGYAVRKPSDLLKETMDVKKLEPRLTNNEMKIYSTLASFFIRRRGEKETTATQKELAAFFKSCGFEPTPAELKKALSKFKECGLVKFNDRKLGDSNAPIILLPTLANGCDMEALKGITMGIFGMEDTDEGF